MNRDRVHFYSPYDLSNPMYIDRMVEVVESYENGAQPIGINDYLEMYHIVQFVEHGKYPSDWDDGRISGVKQYKGKIAAYFPQLKPEELPVLYAEAERGYQSTIWQIIDSFKLKGLVLLMLKISEDLDMKRYLGKYGLE